MSDLLSTARTPTKAEVNAVYLLTQIPVTAAERVLHLAAPRILALAYREAARCAMGMCKGVDHTLPPPVQCRATGCNIARALESQAAALEKEVPHVG